MGCDIHLFVETKNPESKRWNDLARYYHGRDYGVFALMAGVRDYQNVVMYPARGIPDEIGYSTRDEYYSEPPFVPNPDWHHVSWLTLDEVKAVAGQYINLWNEKPLALLVLIGFMESIEKHLEQSSRIVFWFDN